MSDATPSTRDRILEAAFDAFMRFGYSGASTAQIARLARVSKRDLYAHFGSKQAMLAACVSERAGRMRQPLSLPTPTDRKGLHETLIQFGTAVVRELGRPEVLATYRLAIAEAEYAPDVAITLDRLGRATTAEALIALLSAARERGLLRGGGHGRIVHVHAHQGRHPGSHADARGRAADRGGSTPAGRGRGRLSVPDLWCDRPGVGG
jgi:AcrR family transcriptional regulator